VKHFFEVKFNLEEENNWRCDFIEVTADKPIGFIDGGFAWTKDGIKYAELSQSELDKRYRGKGLGLLMYELTITRVLEFCIEFHSCKDRNEHSDGVWQALNRKYYNVVKEGRYWKVTREKGIL
jgi:GNAT superfamily N-acetyltransferase